MTNSPKSGGDSQKPREFDLYADEFSVGRDWDAFLHGEKNSKYLRSIPSYHTIEYSAYMTLMQQAIAMREALREAKDFAQDTLARANQAIETECDKCDYQCQGCIRAIDDCEATKKTILKALEQFDEFMKRGEK